MLLMYMLYGICGSYLNTTTNTLYKLNGYINKCNTHNHNIGYNTITYNIPNLSAHDRVQEKLIIDITRHTRHTRVNLSIIMSAYNAHAYIDKSLLQLFLNSASQYEIIVILEGDIDASVRSILAILDSFNNSYCMRFRVYEQRTPIYETSSNNIGMKVSSPTTAYVLTQPDIFIHEHKWDIKLLRHMKSDPSIFGISARCAHNFDGSNKIGQCGADIETHIKSHINTFYSRETANRGPLMLRSTMVLEIGFLDELRFFMDESDHDLFRRSYQYRWKVGYVHVDITSPLLLSSRRNDKSKSEATYLDKQYMYKMRRIVDTSPIIVTAFESSHLKEMLCFIDSLNDYGVHVVIYYLDELNDEIIMTLKRYNSNVIIREFNFNKYPKYFKISRFHEKGHYAWKPIIIEKTAHEFKDIIWLDAGTYISNKHAFSTLMNLARQHNGIYSPASTGVIEQWTHPNMLDYFKNNGKRINLQHSNCNAAIIAVSIYGNDATAFLHEWSKCALDINCIEPVGASRTNHRQDQAAFSVLVSDLIETGKLTNTICTRDAYDNLFYTNGIVHRGCDQFNLLNPVWYWIYACT